jgi:hypothetical protein
MDAAVAADLRRRASAVQALVDFALGSGVRADLEVAHDAAAGLRWALFVALAGEGVS